MAIKIKKKDGKQEEPAEDVAAEVEGTAVALSDEADPFFRASWETASWIEKNRAAVFGGVIAVFVGVVGGYMGLQFLEGQKVSASSALTPAFESYNTLLDGSKELEAIKSNPDIEAPKKTFKSDSERWQAVYDTATGALSKHPTTEMALAARLSKAAAAAKLGKHDESIALYQEYLGSTTDNSMKVAATQGLATTYAAAEKWDEAVKSLDALADLDPAFAKGARYQKARVLERSGKPEEAKKLYHEILDTDPDHPGKADIERRLANM